MKFKLLGILLFLISGLIGCYPGNAFDEELDIAITLFDEDANFSSNRTFAMPDTVMEFGDGISSLDGRFDDDIIAQVRSQMKGLGYTEITDFDDQVPDVVVLLSKTVNTSVEVYTYVPNWWDYWGYYPVWPIYGPIGPGYAPYYPWGARSVHSYTTGTLIIEMLNPDDTSMAERIPAIWAGAINGVFERTDSQLGSRISNSIDQLFNQSPYLKVQ
jgi:hypothetical protein